jgi:hypothetical protein
MRKRSRFPFALSTSFYSIIAFECDDIRYRIGNCRIKMRYSIYGIEGKHIIYAAFREEIEQYFGREKLEYLFAKLQKGIWDKTLRTIWGLERKKCRELLSKTINE